MERTQQATDFVTDLAPRSPLRCGVCGLPVVRSWEDPPRLLHQVLSGHGSPGTGAVDVYLGEAPCPQEGVPIPADSLHLFPYVAPGSAA
jgi:hypothetical protein